MNILEHRYFKSFHKNWEKVYICFKETLKPEPSTLVGLYVQGQSAANILSLKTKLQT